MTKRPIGRSRLIAARALAWVWRFRLLPFAGRLFGGLAGPLYLRRRFCNRWLYLDVARSNAQRLLFLEGERFMVERSIISRLAAPGSVVVDVGANIGYYVLLIERCIGRAGRIICFEPEPDNLIELRMNVEKNSLQNVEVRPFAVGAAGANVAFARGINGGVLGDGVGATDAAVQVPMISLDDALSGHVDLIKIDVEGYEEEVLQGALETMRRWRPKVFLEIHPTLMTGGRSTEGVLAILNGLYSRIDLYEPLRNASVWRRILARYSRIGAIRSLDRNDVLHQCRNLRQDTFWAVCSEARIESRQESLR